MGDLQTDRDRARQGLAAGWGGSLLRGMASGVGISFKAWPWGGSLVGGGEVLWLYRFEKKKKKKILC
jgi:predicted lipid-binding transport protein (Tim44 family)